MAWLRLDSACTDDDDADGYHVVMFARFACADDRDKALLPKHAALVTRNLTAQLESCLWRLTQEVDMTVATQAQVDREVAYTVQFDFDWDA